MRNRPRRGQTKTAGAFKHDWYAWTRPEARFYTRSRRRNKNNVEMWNSTITTLCTREMVPCKNPCSKGIRPRPWGRNQFSWSLCGLLCQGLRCDTGGWRTFPLGNVSSRAGLLSSVTFSSVPMTMDAACCPESWGEAALVGIPSSFLVLSVIVSPRGLKLGCCWSRGPVHWGLTSCSACVLPSINLAAMPRIRATTILSPAWLQSKCPSDSPCFSMMRFLICRSTNRASGAAPPNVEKPQALKENPLDRQSSS